MPLRIVQDWKVEDRHAVAQFFGTPSGARFLESLRISRPKLGGASTELAAANGNQAAGYEQCIDNMAAIVAYDPNKMGGDALEPFDPNAETSRVIE